MRARGLIQAPQAAALAIAIAAAAGYIAHADPFRSAPRESLEDVVVGVAADRLAGERVVPIQEQREVEAFGEAGGRARRDGDRLTLRLATGEIKVYKNGPSCEDEAAASCYGFAFAGYDKSTRLFAVERYYYEGSDWILLDEKMGAETSLESKPAFSPTGDLAVEFVYGPDGYDADGPAIRIWRRYGRTYRLEWRRATAEDTYFNVLGWPSPGRIDLKSITNRSWDTRAKRPIPEIERRFSLHRHAKTWRVFAADGVAR